MAVQIQFRRGTATEWASTATNPILALAEMGIETDTNLFKIGDGYRHWNDLPYGGVQGYVGSKGDTGSIGPSVAVQNVLYVSKSGNDANDGTTLVGSKLTIAAALAIATRGTTIFVKSGDYTEITPLNVPDFVSIVGDNLRSVTVRPQVVTDDIFYVNNGTYIAHMTFKDHEHPAAAVSFNPDGSAGVISTSPYVQNCTSMTTTGTGMRVDGNYALGTKSMMVDAFTQYNQGGIGIHMLNGGYASLVSVFTICCDKGFLCESGGFCSITNSNSSFGNYALYADGVSTATAQGKIVGSNAGKIFTVTNLTSIPSVGDAFSFGNGDYYTISSAGALSIGNTVVAYPSITAEGALYRNARQIILSELSTLQAKTINWVLKTYPGFDFNQFKCSRDVGTILNSVCYDMVLNSNYQTVLAGNSYYRAVSSTVTGSQFTQTLAAMQYLKDQTLLLLSIGTDPYTRVSDLFDVIVNIFQNGAGVSPPYQFNAPTGASTNVVNAAAILQANKTFIEEETTAYISNFTYNTSTCYRDTGLIVDSLAFDLLYNGTSQSSFAALQYWSHNGYVGNIGRELTTTTAAIAYARDEAVNVALLAGGAGPAAAVTDNFNSILYVLNTGTVGITDMIIPNTAATTDIGVVAAYNALLDSKSTIQDNTISWINSTYPAFGYNQETCSRDTGLIVDSLAFDLLYDGTSQSTFAGLQYWSHNGYTGEIAQEITTTTNAITYLSIATSNIALGIGGGEAQTAILNKFDILLSTLSDVTGATDNIVPNGVASTNATVLSIYDAILADKATLQADTINWINSNNPEFTYNTSTCYRDVGYIIDAIAFDYLHGGNRQSIMSGAYYYGFGNSTVIANEIPQTTAAYDFIKTIASDIIRGIPVTTHYQSALTQTITASTATAIEAALLVDKINIITDIIANGPSAAPAKVPMGLIASTTATVVNAFTLLQSNREFIRAETIGYINEFYSYDRDVCRRDVGYIIDSVAFDLLHSGNRQSIMSGVYYYGFNSTSTVIANEIPQTTAAYEFLNTLTKNIILGNVSTGTYQTAVMPTISTSTGTITQTGIIDNIVANITGIINNGPTAAPAKTPISLTASTATAVINSFNLLLANREFVQAEVTAYINASFIDLSYDPAICKRDVGYIIDAVTYDLLYGGNSQTSVAADAYYDGNIFRISNGEKAASAAAYYYIGTLMSDLLTNTSIVPNQVNVIQDTSSYSAATVSEGNTAKGLLNIVSTVVRDAYTSIVTLAENNPTIIANNTVVTFHTFSQIQSSAHNFEWIGAGTNIDAALPYLGGVPITENQAVAVNGGKVYFTGTDQKGNFQIGNELTINNNLGTISGRTFTKSLFAVMTPYILAIGA